MDIVITGKGDPEIAKILDEYLKQIEKEKEENKRER